MNSKKILRNIIREAFFKELNDYKSKHYILKDESSSTLDNMTKGISVPEDFYTNIHHYTDLRNKPEQDSVKIIEQVKGKPDAIVAIYRAVPKGVKNINKGDWVSLSLDYAKHHGEHHENPKLNMPVISKKVKASEVVWDGNDILEFAYYPES